MRHCARRRCAAGSNKHPSREQRAPAGAPGTRWRWRRDTSPASARCRTAAWGSLLHAIGMRVRRHLCLVQGLHAATLEAAAQHMRHAQTRRLPHLWRCAPSAAHPAPCRRASRLRAAACTAAPAGGATTSTAGCDQQPVAPTAMLTQGNARQHQPTRGPLPSPNPPPASRPALAPPRCQSSCPGGWAGRRSAAARTAAWRNVARVWVLGQRSSEAAEQQARHAAGGAGSGGWPVSNANNFATGGRRARTSHTLSPRKASALAFQCFLGALPCSCGGSGTRQRSCAMLPPPPPRPLVLGRAACSSPSDVRPSSSDSTGASAELLAAWSAVPAWVLCSRCCWRCQRLLVLRTAAASGAGRWRCSGGAGSGVAHALRRVSVDIVLGNAGKRELGRRCTRDGVWGLRKVAACGGAQTTCIDCGMRERAREAFAPFTATAQHAAARSPRKTDRPCRSGQISLPTQSGRLWDRLQAPGGLLEAAGRCAPSRLQPLGKFGRRALVYSIATLAVDP